MIVTTKENDDLWPATIQLSAVPECSVIRLPDGRAGIRSQMTDERTVGVIIRKPGATAGSMERINRETEVTVLAYPIQAANAMIDNGVVPFVEAPV